MGGCEHKKVEGLKRVVGRANNNANANGGCVYANANNASTNSNTNNGARLANKKNRFYGERSRDGLRLRPRDLSLGNSSSLWRVGKRKH